MEACKGMIILSGNSHKELANVVANNLNLDLGRCSITYSSSNESWVEVQETVRGKDVYIIQTGTKNVNRDITDLLIMVQACKSSSARQVIVAMPYLPYCKQSKMRKRGSIVCQLLAKMLCKAGISHLITLDLYAKEIQGFFDVPVDNLRASPFLIQYIENNIPDYRNAVIVAKSPSSVQRASSYAERLRLSISMIHGEGRYEGEDHSDGRNSPPVGSFLEERSRSLHIGSSVLPLLQSKEKPPLNLVGNVTGRTAIIVDGMIDEVDHFVAAADLLRSLGALKVYVLATHGLLSNDAAAKINASFIDEVVVTNTIPQDIHERLSHKIRTVDISVLLSEAIRRIHNNESMAYLFRNVHRDD